MRTSFSSSVDFEFLRFGEDGDRDRRGMDAPLRLRFGHALHAVHAALVFQAPVGALAADVDDGFLHAAELRLVEIDGFEAEAVLFAVPLVHAVELIGKERRFLAARARADLEGAAPVVLLVLGKEQQFELVFEGRELLFEGVPLFEQQLLHFARLLFRFRKGGVHLLFRAFALVILERDLFEGGPLLGICRPAGGIGGGLGGGEEFPQRFVPRRDVFDFAHLLCRA